VTVAAGTDQAAAVTNVDQDLWVGAAPTQR
jgi:hypothetical protein